MHILAVTIFLLFAAWMAWRGWRRGGLRTLLGWLPLMAAGAVLIIGLWLAWVAITYFIALATVALVATVATLIVCFWAIRSARRHSDRHGPQHFLHHHPSSFRNPQFRLLNRLLGALLGLGSAAMLSLLLATVGSTIPLAYALAPNGAAGATAPTPRWVEGLGRACTAVADVASFGILDHVPRLGAYARELRALVRLLNAPRDKLQRLAERQGLAGLADLPEVQAALSDPAYLDLIDRAAHGSLPALKALTQSPTTRALLDAPQVRHFTSTLTPSLLARELDPGPGSGP